MTRRYFCVHLIYCHLLQLLYHHNHDPLYHQCVSGASQIPCCPPSVTSLISSTLTPVRGEAHGEDEHLQTTDEGAESQIGKLTHFGSKSGPLPCLFLSQQGLSVNGFLKFLFYYYYY